MDLSDHTDCCGSECKLFHVGACSFNLPRLFFLLRAPFGQYGPVAAT